MNIDRPGWRADFIVSSIEISGKIPAEGTLPGEQVIPIINA
jgi:hypothetical protein